jgi:predicted metal-dependent hydrolase
MTDLLPRLVPNVPLPAYAFVPGGPFPRPTGSHSPESGLLDAANWRPCAAYLYGFDLFNQGYYWEAHEVWEGLWHLCGRTGPVADCLKGLIKFAAAGVKVRERQPAGVQSHARRAAEIFRQLAGGLEEHRLLGLDLAFLVRMAEQLANQPPAAPANNAVPVVHVFDFILMPCESA